MPTPLAAAPSDTTNDDPNCVSVPKPDIAISLAYTSFDRLRVLSEPHQSGIGLHFPFLIMEVKGLATGSNMVRAQNQAAVGGACALGILRDLQFIAQGCITCATADQPRLRQMMFSVVTVGPIHEMWVHYKIEEEFYMTILRIWRTTFPKDVREFVSIYKALDAYGQALHERRVE
ncbi:hypothetical protein EJ04DRAFT_544333 [Polyplosphaeria fusca]|uniref:DUF7924 domain-containing protein n=1 Tax=Polyplosphaeria fusca TaxID=682080 RepID=A0A9P4QVC5_9PLEO|nr:hypothetical protein EJ04DRAFT_544333 [Polyplosphaeria fusca]